MKSRRSFIKTGLYGAGAMTLGAQHLFANNSKTSPPTRFIFLRKGNGLLPDSVVPSSLNAKDLAAEKNKTPLEVDLDKHDLKVSGTGRAFGLEPSRGRVPAIGQRPARRRRHALVRRSAHRLDDRQPRGWARPKQASPAN